MKKTTKAAVLYYIVLLGGFFIFLGFVYCLYHYEDAVQNFVDRYPYIFFPALFGYMYVYLRAIKRVVLTKDFQQFERESIKKAEKSKARNLKRMKIVIPILAIFSVVNMIFSFYIAFQTRGGADINWFLQKWTGMFTIPFIVLWAAIYWYRNTKKSIENKKDEITHSEE